MAEALNVGQFVLVDRQDGQPETYTTTAANVIDALRNLGGALGQVLGSVVETMGNIIGGALELGIGVFKYVADGVLKFTKAIGEWIAYVFAPNPDAVFPTFFSPIKADLEGVAAPIIDRIRTEHARVDESLERISELGSEQEKLRTATDELRAEQAGHNAQLIALNKDMDAAIGELAGVSSKIDARVKSLETTTAATAKKLDQYAVTVDGLGPKVSALETANKNVGKTVWELADFTSRMDTRLATFKTQMTADLNVAGQITAKINAYNSQLATRLKSGGDIANQIKTAADNAATAGAKGFNDWWAANGSSFVNMQAWYTNWNNGQWAIQKSVNDLQNNWNAKVMATLNTQVKANSDQSTFNAMVVEFTKVQRAYNDKNSDLWAYQKDLNKQNSALWKLQKAVNQDNVDLWGFQNWYNAKNDALWTMQKAWNNTQTGWNATQEKINANRAEWEANQESINDELQGALSALEKAQDEILDLQQEMFEYIPRRLVSNVTNAVVENAHFRISANNQTVTALGSWIGEAAIRNYCTSSANVVSGDGSVDVQTTFERAMQVPQVLSNGTLTRTWTLPRPSGANSKVDTVAIDYWIYRGTPRVSRASGTNRLLPITPPSTNAGWTQLSTFTVTHAVNHRVHYNLKWAGATYGDRYGVRILLNGVVLASRGPNLRVGPMTSLGSGVRSMNIPEISQTFKVGDVLSFQAYFQKLENRSGAYETERTIRSWNRAVSWVEPPKEG